MSIRKNFKTLALASIALGLGVAALPAGAVGTAAGTSVTNRATLSYTVGGVAQTVINSSPTGNSTPGAAGGADTAFVVDRIVNYTLTTVDTTAVVGTPGQTLLVTTYLVTNTGNDKEAMALSAANLVGGTVLTSNVDTIDMSNIKVYYGPDAVSAYNAGTVVLGNLDNLLADASRRLFVVADMPVTAKNGDGANVRLTAKAAVAGSAGATLETATVGADNAAVVDVVINAAVATTTAGVTTSVKTSDSGYAVSAPTLTVQKSEVVISDPVNGVSANAKAIPGATVEYTLTITNTGTTAANGVAFTDPIATTLTLSQSVYNTTQNVTITSGGTTRYCTAEAGGTDSNADGCLFAANSISVNPTTAIVIGTGAANTAVIKYRVTIN